MVVFGPRLLARQERPGCAVAHAPRGLMAVALAVGIDLGATSVHVVKLGPAPDGRHAVVATRVFPASELAPLGDLCAGASGVAVDAPERLSRDPHGHDAELPPKFRSARCCEVASLQAHGWPAVPWVTPSAGAPVPRWMDVGFAVWALLRDHVPMEVYPHACFYRLNGNTRAASKRTTAGRVARLDLLRTRLVLPPDADRWSHDVLDAAVAALVAAQGRREAEQVPHECPDYDGSELWVPA
jgi:hypothetical protein